MVRCGRGHTAALNELMDRYRDAAYRYAWRIFRNHHTAEDITQEFFVKLFRNAARYQPRGHFTTYFYRVLANLCFDLLRKRKRRKTKPTRASQQRRLDSKRRRGETKRQRRPPSRDD